MANRKQPPPHLPAPEHLPPRNTVAITSELSADNNQFFIEFALLMDELKKHPYIKKASCPRPLQGMQATEADMPFNHPDWLFEMKLNGIRTQIFSVDYKAGNPQIQSEERLGEPAMDALRKALLQWPVRAVLDGEVVLPQAQDEEGPANTQLSSAIYYAFDLMWLEGFDLTQLPLIHRKQILQQLLPESGCIRFSDHIEEWGEDFYYLARSGHQPGIVARHKFSAYQAGISSKWLVINIEYSAETKGLQTIENTIPSFEVEDRDEKMLQVDGLTLKLVRPGSIFHKKEQVLKKDIICYYLDVAEVLLPYLTDRPLLMEEPSKPLLNDLHAEKWINFFEQENEVQSLSQYFAIVTSAASLAFLTNHNYYTFQPWHSRISTLAYPDWSILTITTLRSFDMVVATATVLHQILRSFDIPCYPKTSEKGIDVYIPLGAKFNFEQSRQLAQVLVSMLQDELPLISTERNENGKRMAQVLVSYQGNQAKAAAPAPYSLLTAGGIAVSAPLHWDEVKAGINPENFHVKNMRSRLRETGDLFHPVLNKGVDLNHILKGLATLLKDSDHFD